MAPINGRPFLEYQLSYWISEGVQRFVISVGYKHESIVSHFGNVFLGASIDYAVESDPLGTGGGLLLAMEKLTENERFLVLNGDTYFEVSLAALKHFHYDRSSDITVALFQSDCVGRYIGVATGYDGRIASFEDATPGGWANGGVYLMSRSALSGTGWRAGERVSLEGELLPAVQRRGKRLFGMRSEGVFIDIGVPEDYARAGSLLVGRRLLA
jgi:D-glycero-alpha-D-manno-heptose 1-phosphate guanylyltransferase